MGTLESNTLKSSREHILLLEKRLEELKLEFNECEAKLDVAEAGTLKAIESAAAESSKSAYDRALRMVEVTRNWLLLLFGITLVVGAGSFLQIKSFVQDYTMNQVKAWLNVTDDSSPLHEPLSRLTTRAAADILVLERARNGLRSMSLGEVKISGVWIDKLLADLAATSTSLTDFTDIALAVSTEASLIGGGEYRGKVIEAVKKMLLGSDLDNRRKTILLRTFGFEIALREVAEHLFVNTKDIEVQGAAFQLLRRTSVPSYLVQLARPILSTKIDRDNEEQKGLVLQAAEVVANYDVEDASLTTWLKSKNNTDTDILLDNVLVGLSALAPIGKGMLLSEKISDAEKEARFAFAVQRLHLAIEGGAEIGWVNGAAKQPIIAVHVVKPGGISHYMYIHEPETLLTKSLGGRLLSSLGRNGKGLEKLVKAITAGADDRLSFGQPFRVEVNLGKKDSLTTSTGDVITMARIGNPVYLERSLGEDSSVLMRWRDIDGVFKVAYLKDASIKGARVEIIPASPAMETYLSGYSYNNLPIM